MCTLEMCISITEADAIRISMHSQPTIRYIKYTYEAASDAIHLCYEAVRFDHDSIQHNVIRCNEKNMITFHTDRQQIINQLVFWLLTPRGLFQKTRLSNKPGLFQLVWLTVKWFGSIKQI